MLRNMLDPVAGCRAPASSAESLPLHDQLAGTDDGGVEQSVDPHDLSALTERHEVDHHFAEFFLAAADDADASLNWAWWENDVHECPTVACCGVEPAVSL